MQKIETGISELLNRQQRDRKSHLRPGRRRADLSEVQRKTGLDRERAGKGSL